MPERVKKLEGQILSLYSQLEDLRSDMHQLVQVLKEAVFKEKYSLPMKDERYIS
jgi:regulator of replication initiation timing